MTNYVVSLSQEVFYQVTVDAADEADATTLALEEHENGTDTEVDSGPAEVTDIAEIDEAERAADLRDSALLVTLPRLKHPPAGRDASVPQLHDHVGR
jgi:hypothetical protein